VDGSQHNQRQRNQGTMDSGRVCSLCIAAFSLIAMCALASGQDAITPGHQARVPAVDTAAPADASVANQPVPDSAVPLAQPPAAKASQPEPAPVSKRLFGMIPNYRADQTSDSYQPLTVAQKFKIAREDSFDWPNFPLLVGYTLQAQVAAGGFRHNGGMEGFGEYYARGFADQVIGSYVTEAILPSLLHEDPRYFRLGAGTFVHRVANATAHVFITRGDNGKTRFFASEVLGNAAVAAIGSTYYPNSGSPSEISEHYGLQLGNDAVSNILTEFWPDIRLRLRFVRQRLVTSLLHH
jgi:hypothetical protein